MQKLERDVAVECPSWAT